MLLKTYEKIMTMFDKSQGYLTTKELQAEKITMIQIRDLINMGAIERVTHGVYWKIDKANGKPENYKYAELAMANSKSIICAASALYVQGFIDVEPDKVSVATARNDRARMNVNFPISRHYFSDLTFNDHTKIIETPVGNFTVYDIDRSVCDCIRLEDSIDKDLFISIIDAYKAYPDKDIEKFKEYASQMRFKKIAAHYISN